MADESDLVVTHYNGFGEPVVIDRAAFLHGFTPNTAVRMDFEPEAAGHVVKPAAPLSFRATHTSVHAFASGASSSEVKPRYHLIPASALRREAIRFAEGAQTHGEHNWQKGETDREYRLDRLNHLLEHAIRYANGDRTEDHLAAIRCNTAMLIEFEERDKEHM